MKFFRKDWILYDEIAKDGGKRPDTLIELRIKTSDEHNLGHIPVITQTATGYEIKHQTAQQVDHPMNIKHHLVTCVLQIDDRWVHRYDFHHDDKPTVAFNISHAATSVVAYSFCNLHGLYYFKLK